ncbi:hypothetical protein V6Z11_A11G183700 [Gossypium hirsutum]
MTYFVGCAKISSLLTEERLFVKRITQECCYYCELTILFYIMHGSCMWCINIFWK